MADGAEKHMAAGMPHWNAVQRAKSAIGEHPPATAGPIVIHALGIVELCLGALAPALEEERRTAVPDEPNRNYFASSPTLSASSIEVGIARQTSIITPDVRVWKSSGSGEIQRPIGGGGTDASRHGRLIPGGSKPNKVDIAVHGAEVSSYNSH